MFWGGIWNDVDDCNEIFGCVVYCLGWIELYNFCVDVGVRVEMFFGVLEGYEELESDDEEEDEEDVY